MRSAGLALSLLLVATGCAGRDAPTRLEVSAAASLTDAFQDVAAAFEAQYAGRDEVEVALNVAGSATLVEQVLRGAPVDVVATADRRTMQRLVESGAVGHPVPFASNTLVVAHPGDGPDRDAADLADPDLLVGLCAPQVPCGAAAAEALEAMGITPSPDTEDADVRTLLARLERGELDLGVVYATDLAAADRLAGEPLAGSRTTLVVAPAADAPAEAERFVDFVRSPAGTRILADHGFAVVGPDA